MVNRSVFNKGDWVVHVNYGIGRVIAQEKKCLEEREILYYRIEGEDGTFWLPVNNAHTARVRPVVSQIEMQKAIQVLEDSPQELEKNHRQRQVQIKEVLSKCSIDQTASLVRDLLFTQSERKLNVLEQETLDKLKKHLIMEWSVVLDIKPQEARMQLREMFAVDDI